MDWSYKTARNRGQNVEGRRLAPRRRPSRARLASGDGFIGRAFRFRGRVAPEDPRRGDQADMSNLVVPGERRSPSIVVTHDREAARPGTSGRAGPRGECDVPLEGRLQRHAT